MKLNKYIATIKAEILAELTQKEGSNHLTLNNTDETTDAYINGELFCKYSHSLIPYYAIELGFSNSAEAMQILLEGKSAGVWVTVVNGEIKYWQQSMVWNRALTVGEVDILCKDESALYDADAQGKGVPFQGKGVPFQEKELTYGETQNVAQQIVEKVKEAVEPFLITEVEREPFPALEDIEWVMVEAPEWYEGGEVRPMESMIICDDAYGVNTAKMLRNLYPGIKLLHENSKDFTVTWRTKSKINRKLHENKPLAMAMGRWIVETGAFFYTSNGHSKVMDCVISISYKENEDEEKQMMFYSPQSYWKTECTIPVNYEIPEQVIQWMKEYEEVEK
jgi:hypothetical protein